MKAQVSILAVTLLAVIACGRSSGTQTSAVASESASAGSVANPKCKSQAIEQAQGFAADDGDMECSQTIIVTFKSITTPRQGIERYKAIADCRSVDAPRESLATFQYILDFDASQNCKPLTPER